MLINTLNKEIQYSEDKGHEVIDPSKTFSYHEKLLGTNFNWNKFAAKLFILVIQGILLQEDDANSESYLNHQKQLLCAKAN